MYTTEQGDTWDLIAYKVYGASRYIYAVKPLIRANMDIVKTVEFSAGVSIVTPILMAAETAPSPPWRDAS